MPWHRVQFFRITFQTSPSGRETCGRVGLRPWAERGKATSSSAARMKANVALLLRLARLARILFLGIISRLFYRQTAGDAVHLVTPLDLSNLDDLGGSGGLGIDIRFGTREAAKSALGRSVLDPPLLHLLCHHLNYIRMRDHRVIRHKCSHTDRVVDRH